MNYYRHHIGDYLRDTAHLTMLEDAAYRRLLDLYYMREQAIPADVDQAARLIRARTPDEREAVATVLAEFFFLASDGWRQKRADHELQIAHEAAERARLNGRFGGRPGGKSRPTVNPEETQPVISGIPTPNPNESSPSSILHPPPVCIPKSRGRNFVAPTLQEVQTFIAEHGYPVDPARFVDYYTGNGWKVGKTGMKDWQAVIRNWSRNTGVSHASGNQPGRNPSADRSAAGRVRANVARARAERAAAAAGGDSVAIDGELVRAQVG